MPDEKTPTPGEIVIMASGVVALIFSFLHFYTSPSSTSVTVGGRTITTSGGGGSISAWGKGLFPIATLIALLCVIMAAQIALTKFAGLDLPARVAGFTWEQIHLVFGFFAALIAVCFLITSKRGLDFGVGFWFELIAGIAALVGAILLSRERAGPAV